MVERILLGFAVWLVTVAILGVGRYPIPALAQVALGFGIFVALVVVESDNATAIFQITLATMGGGLVVRGVDAGRRRSSGRALPRLTPTGRETPETPV